MKNARVNIKIALATITVLAPALKPIIILNLYNPAIYTIYLYFFTVRSIVFPICTVGIFDYCSKQMVKYPKTWTNKSSIILKKYQQFWPLPILITGIIVFKNPTNITLTTIESIILIAWIITGIRSLISIKLLRNEEQIFYTIQSLKYSSELILLISISLIEISNQLIIILLYESITNEIIHQKTNHILKRKATSKALTACQIKNRKNKDLIIAIKSGFSISLISAITILYHNVDRLYFATNTNPELYKKILEFSSLKALNLSAVAAITMIAYKKLALTSKKTSNKKDNNNHHLISIGLYLLATIASILTTYLFLPTLGETGAVTIGICALSSASTTIFIYDSKIYFEKRYAVLIISYTLFFTLALITHMILFHTNQANLENILLVTLILNILRVTSIATLNYKK